MGLERAAPEDALVIAEVMRQLTDLLARLPLRADGCVNHRDLYDGTMDLYERATKEAGAAYPPDRPHEFGMCWCGSEHGPGKDGGSSG